MKRRIKVGYEGRSEELEVNQPEGEPVPWDAASQLSQVGQPTPRLEAIAKVTGRARFTHDISLPGMLIARVLRSPLPAARLVSVDLEEAYGLDGVRAVWSESAGKRIFYAGQEVAAVAADSAAIAEAALALIDVKYQPLPFVVDALAAQQPGAPAVFGRAGAAPGGERPAERAAERAVPEPDDEVPGARFKLEGNVRTMIVSEPPGVDIDRAFAEAAVVVENTFRTQVQTHAALETHGAVAWWQGDELTLWCSTQAAFAVRDQVAVALRIPRDRVRVLCEHVGGGFGAKFDAGPHTLIAARLARDAQAPVKLMLSRHEEHLCTGNRPDSVQWLKLGARQDGTLVALHLRSYGATGVGTGAGVGGPARTLYRIKSFRTEESDVFINAGPAQPFRAPGHPQGIFALEQSIDELAGVLGMDPIDLRKRNLRNPVQIAELERITAGPLSIITAGGVAKRASVWQSRARVGQSRGPIKRGMGLACGLWYRIVSRGVQVQIDVHSDARIEVKCGAVDIGTGTRTLIALVAAEELSLPLSSITVRLGDTSLPHGPAAGGSTSATSVAPAVRSAALQARRRLLEIAGRLLEADPGELLLRDGMISVRRDLGGGISLAQVCTRIPGEKLSVLASRPPDFEGRYELTGGVQIAEVEVDTRTGQVRVLRVTAIHDCGRVLNPLTAVSQINGGILQGISYALLEDRVIDRPSGLVLNADLEAYKILCAVDVPEISPVLFATSPGWNTTGAIGLGEPPIVPTAAAIANAIENAIGLRIRELPITPERVLAALEAAAETVPLEDPKGIVE